MLCCSPPASSSTSSRPSVYHPFLSVSHTYKVKKNNCDDLNGPSMFHHAGTVMRVCKTSIYLSMPRPRQRRCSRKHVQTLRRITGRYFRPVSRPLPFPPSFVPSVSLPPPFPVSLRLFPSVGPSCLHLVDRVEVPKQAADMNYHLIRFKCNISIQKMDAVSFRTQTVCQPLHFSLPPSSLSDPFLRVCKKTSRYLSMPHP